MHDVVIVGAGGFAREVYRWANDALSPDRYRLKGFLTNRSGDLDGFAIPYPILGDPDTYEVQPNERFIIAIGYVGVKKRIVDGMQARGAQFLSLIHPTAVVAPSATIGAGVVVCPFALVSESVVLEDFVMLNFYASVGHDSVIGRYSILSPYATVNGFTVLEPEVFMATHSTVIARKRVGQGAKISANSVAMQDVQPRTLVHGVPGQHSAIFGGTS